MNLSISDEPQLFSKELQRYMSPHALGKLARKNRKPTLWILKALQTLRLSSSTLYPTSLSSHA
ncbi:hypothetical protein COD94_23615 [Bacillus cereus]|nr:hypothetical protein COD94_23615 [Bacillus cereus]